MNEVKQQIAEWICDLNGWKWPDDWPKNPQATREDFTNTLRVLEFAVPYDEWVEVWKARNPIAAHARL